MSWAPAERVLETVAAQREAMAKEEARIRSFGEYHAAEQAKLDAEKKAAIHDLALALLPRLDAPTIARAAETVGLVGLPGEDLPGQVVERRAWLESRLTAILGDPRFANRELLRHPRTGSLSTAIAENEDFRRPVLAVVIACEGHPMFERLYRGGFGTPEQAASWWRYSYWQDRSAADEILAKFPGKTFAEVRADYAQAKDTVAVYDADLARLHAEVAAGRALDHEYATLYEEHRTLDARALEWAQTRITQHLLTSDTSLVSQRLRASPAVLLLFLRASGLTAKMSYLEGIHRSTVDEMQRELVTLKARLDGVETRTRRRWAPMPMEKFHKLAEDRQVRRERRWQRSGKVYTTVYSYDRYDRGRGYDDLLWWDVMTRGRYDGSYLPEVELFHAEHPGYVYDPDWKTLAAEATAEDDLQGYDTDDAAAAAAEADQASDDASDPSTTDAS